MKIISLFSIALLFLQSCGNETTRNQSEQEAEYRYVEISECTIPVPTKFKELTSSDTYLYRFWYRQNSKNFVKVNISVNKKNDYVDYKNFIMQEKTTQLQSDYYRNFFKIIKWNVIDPIHDEGNYNLFGFKTNIHLINYSETELNHLLEYCQKTWKLDKGEK